jgi:hypothetical protein
MARRAPAPRVTAVYSRSALQQAAAGRGSPAASSWLLARFAAYGRGARFVRRARLALEPIDQVDVLVTDGQ